MFLADQRAFRVSLVITAACTSTLRNFCAAVTRPFLVASGVGVASHDGSRRLDRAFRGDDS
jgi:hypothetical protein